jgi:hypothetical protein
MYALLSKNEKEKGNALGVARPGIYAPISCVGIGDKRRFIVLQDGQEKTVALVAEQK